MLGELGLFALDAVEGWSADSGHWMAGMTDGGDLGVIAHSMGGIAMAHTVDLEPRVQRVIGFSPYRDGDHQWDAYAGFTGSALMLTGDEDKTSPPEMVRDEWYADLDQPARGVYGVMLGTGHQAVTDIEFEEAALTDAEQMQVSADVAEAFLLAEHFDDEDAWHTLLCDPPTPWFEQASAGRDAVTSVAIESDALVRLGLAGAGAREATVYVATAPGGTETEHGVIGLHEATVATQLTLPEGVGCLDLALYEDVAGIAWVQVAFAHEGDVQLGRVVDIFETGATTPEDEPGDDGGGTGGDDGGGTGGGEDGGGTDGDAGGTGGQTDTPAGSTAADDARERGGCACASTGAGGAAGLALLPLLAVARRRR